jgi:hypothetical protein
VLIDLTRKPLVLYPEDCTSSVVMRTIGNRVVSGLVGHVTEGARGLPSRRVDIRPGAQITRGDSTCYETRLPLPAPGLGYMAEQYTGVPPEGLTITTSRVRRWRDDPKMALAEEPKSIRILPEPFEAASVYKDFLTEVSGTWRIAVRIEFLEKLKKAPWIISVLDATTGDILASVAVSGLNPNPVLIDPLPLKKAVERVAQPANAWTRILDDTD